MLLAKGLESAHAVLPRPDLVATAAHIEPDIGRGIARDYHAINEDTFGEKPHAADGERKLYTGALAALCNEKSALLHRSLLRSTDARAAKSVVLHSPTVLIDFLHTYRRLVTPGIIEQAGYWNAARSAYTKTNGGAHIIAALQLDYAVSSGYHVAHEISLRPHFADMLRRLQAAGYERTILATNAFDDARADAAIARAKTRGGFLVSTAELDARRALFPQHLSAALKLAETVELSFKEQPTQPATVVRLYELGKATTTDQLGYKRFQDQYEQDRTALARRGLVVEPWSALDESYLERARLRVNAAPSN